MMDIADKNPKITVSENDILVALKDDLDLYNVPIVRPAVLDAVSRHPGRCLRLDLSAIDFVDSAGLAFILALRKAPALDGRFAIVVASGSHPERVLRLTRLDSFIEVIRRPIDSPET